MDAEKQVKQIDEIRAVLARCALLATKLENPLLDKKSFMLNMDAVDQVLNMGKPEVRCGYCSGNGCRACKDTGWVSTIIAAMQPGEFDAS
jgi:hypothetical protein